MMNQDFIGIQDQIDLDRQMLEFPNFARLQNELKQDEVYYGH